jgi:hypothetical protein
MFTQTTIHTGRRVDPLGHIISIRHTQTPAALTEEFHHPSEILGSISIHRVTYELLYKPDKNVIRTL